MPQILTTKTAWAGIAGVVTAAAAYATGEATAAQALMGALQSLALVFLRAGVAKVQ